MEDFPDQLSPILVKEIRQGMRSRVFVFSLLLLQVAMVLLSIFGLTAAFRGEATADFAAVYWVLVGLPLLLVVPLSGLGTIAGERTAQTLELLFLTRLTARRIVLGKWLGLMTQAVLLVCAVVPYGVLRYFLGSVSLAEELTYVGTILFASGVLSALAVGCSPLPTWVTRVIAIFGPIGGIWIGAGLMIALRFSAMFGGPSPLKGASGGYAWLFVILAGVVLSAVALEFGAGRVAPPSENHSTPIRAVTLGSLGLAVGLYVRWPSLAALALPLAVLARAVTLGVLCEEPRLIPSLYRPFVRKGFLGRALGRVLYPGWPSGLLFALLAQVLLFGLGQSLRQSYVPHTPTDWSAAVLVAWVDLGAMVVPFACTRLLWPSARQPFVAYLLFQAGTLLLFAIATVVKVVAPAADPTFLFRFIPLYGIASFYGRMEVLPMLGLPTFEAPTAKVTIVHDLAGAAVVTALAFAVLAWRAFKLWREIAACERQAALPREGEAGV